MTSNGVLYPTFLAKIAVCPSAAAAWTGRTVKSSLLYPSGFVSDNSANASQLRVFVGQRFKKTLLLMIGAILVCGTILSVSARAQDQKVFINERWPIGNPKRPKLSPPHVEPTNECAQAVYVDSFIPHATIRVFLGGTTLIGGPVTTEFGFVAVTLTQPLHIGDQITATQTVNGVTSSPSATMTAGTMPSTLPAPTIDPKIYACGQIVPVHNLTSGVNVEVRDLTASSTIGNGATPNLWGGDWDPVSTQALVSGHKITAVQSACTGVKSTQAAAQLVQPEPSPLQAPSLDPPIIGNDALTAHNLYIGSLLRAKQSGVIGSGLSTAGTNWMHVAPPITATPDVSAEQKLCHHSPPSTPQTPTNNIPKPTLVGPICPGQAAAIIRNTTINATLVLLQNNAVVGYGGAAPGDVPLDIAPPSAFAEGDTVQVVEYIGNNLVFSNTIIVGCTNTVTYHNDSQRTGWNPKENTLTPANVRPLTFGLIASVPLDDQVDTQPLVVTNQNIAGQGVHTVVYVTTEGNTVYAIDSWSGSILKSVNLGAPVPMPLGCNNNGPNVGVDGTGTIDLRSRTMYVMAYTLDSGTPVYHLHALDLSTLADRPGSPVTVTASHALANGSAFSFNATVQRQRSALLQSQGNVYAAFASFCDFSPEQSRGWVLGWNAGTLTPLAANKLTDTLPTAPTPWYLSSIWMSGFGVAAEQDGDIFFVTGNSDPNGDTYTGTTNIQESVVKLRSDLSSVMDLFTPSNVFPLDQGDVDYGSGGVMVIPDQPGPVPKLAVAAGKDGRMFIINRASLGGFHNPDIPKNVQVGACWCGPSYFKGSDGIGRVVSSGGFNAETWKINTASIPALAAEGTSPGIPVGPQNDGGFFTSVSSNGLTRATQIIWAIGRPTGGDNHVTLYAFNGTASGGTLPLLWSGAAGTWPNLGGNANLVPTIANGRVYVPSYRQLTIFGLRTLKLRFPFVRFEAEAKLLAPPPPTPPQLPGIVFWGTIKRIDGAHLEIALRTGKLLQVDISEALKAGTTAPPVVGRYVSVRGQMNAQGLFGATIMLRAKGRASWGMDDPNADKTGKKEQGGK
jgi:hypothetical protein